MKKQMVHTLLIILTYTIPANHHITASHQVVTTKDPTLGRSPNKESIPSRSLDSPYTLPGEARFWRSMKSMLEGGGIKSTFTIRFPNQLNCILSPRNMRMKKGEKGQLLIQLPIIKAPPKDYIPILKTT